MGVGRSIPVKQGFLYKKTNSTINKDWKKKFVTLNDDGSLKYYPSMNVSFLPCLIISQPQLTALISKGLHG